ncbi:anti-sigma F factor [Ruminococcus sp. XPD3002]|uniref:anti-sigma F factor n=1 Tax=Ruminococcus sp. XPD3002 TaxID=1452269 RepID=UPI000913538F|nr:anti-sigma F factor [Ruminococcus sp.]MBR6983799.1 anti-sigma F factor [Ruminococcus sp.]SFX31748.1 stage II sporulation protein AB (anti-sigma F factor) [Ruminococcus flavefaciens]HRU97553.1 anti-sigma F factor [Ruminococcus sp.]
MEILNEIKFSLPSHSVNESTARAVVSSFLVQADPTVEELSDIRTAVSEAVTNAIVHGYRGSFGKVDISVKLLAGREIYIRIKDCGCGIPDVKKAMEPLYTTAPEEERSGLGFSVMESFMDKLTVRSVTGKGTTVTMRKRLKVHGR